MTDASDLRPVPQSDTSVRRGPATKRRGAWLAPTGLILLSLVPVGAGASRLTQLATGAISADNTRFFDSPVPVVVHIVSVTVFSLLGALQFAPSLRRHRWHRRAGRIVAPAGMLTALTGIWMALFYTLPAHDGEALLVLRLVFGSAMAASIVIAFVAIRRGDVRTHSAWMTRAYAIGVGAGTQVFTGLVGFLLVGTPDAATWAVAMGAGWVINLAVAEVVIRQRARRSGPASRPSGRSATTTATRHRHRRHRPPIMRGMTSPLRAVWDAPAAHPPPPRRVWRDWVLVGVVPLLVLLEATARLDVPWRELWAAVLIALVPTLLWRRTRPLLMLAISFATGAIFTVVAGGDPQLVSTGYFLILLYAVMRWGTGRAMVLGAALVLAGFGQSLLYGPLTAVDAIGSIAVVVTTISLGVAFRWRAAARARELDRVKLQEREQLARDLHDTVAHHVSAIAIQAQAGTAVAATDPDAAARVLGVIEGEASRTLAEMRSIVRVLRREEGHELAPSPAIADIRQLARPESGGPVVEVQLTGDVDSVPPTIAAAVYRIAQEGVTNARRHARNATRIEVYVHADEAGIRLEVRDDGDVAASAAPGYGITGMIERAMLLGGTCEAGSARGGGWAVTAVLPRTGWST